jgi:hypothetical protein
MNKGIPFQYATVRYVHDIVTGEFLNVGLALYSPEGRYLKTKILPNYRRITNAFPSADGDFYRRYVTHLQIVAEKVAEQVAGRQVSMNAAPERLESVLQEILPVDDSSLQFSGTKYGSADDLDGVFDNLYARLVEQHLPTVDKSSRDDNDVWNVFRKPLQSTQAILYLHRHVVQTAVETFEFAHAWKNGNWNILQPLSFDLINPGSIRKKAREWWGTALILKNSQEPSHVYMLLGRPRLAASDLKRAYGDAKKILSSENAPVELIDEDEAEDFANRISPMIKEHAI